MSLDPGPILSLSQPGLILSEIVYYVASIVGRGRLGTCGAARTRTGAGATLGGGVVSMLEKWSVWKRRHLMGV